MTSSTCRRPGILGEPSVEALLARLGGPDDAQARSDVVERFLPLARRLARRYAARNETPEDLVQVANLGLVKAAGRFDPARGIAFSSFAVPTILGELRRHFRDHSWALHVPRSMQERALEVSAAIDELTERLGRSPGVSDLTAELGWPEERVLEALSTRRAFGADSLDARRSGQDDEGAALVETIGGEDPGFALAEYGASIAGALHSLPETDRRALHLRFVEDLTQTEIAGRLGVSQMQVSRILRRSLDSLRAAAADGTAGAVA